MPLIFRRTSYPLFIVFSFILLSFSHVLLWPKRTKRPVTREFQSPSSLVVNTAFTATRAAPISSVLRTTNCWRCRRFENSRVASDIFQSKRSCRLNFLFDFWVLRDSLSYPLASNRVTSGQTILALFPKIKQVQAVEFNGAG